MTTTKSKARAQDGKRTGISANRVRQRLLIERCGLAPSEVPDVIPDAVWPLVEDLTDDPEGLASILEMYCDEGGEGDAGWARVSYQHWAVAQRGLDATTKLVAHVLLRYARRQGRVPETVSTIQARTGLSRSALYEHLGRGDRATITQDHIELRPTENEKSDLRSLRMRDNRPVPDRVRRYMDRHGLWEWDDGPEEGTVPKALWMRGLLERADLPEVSSRGVLLAASVLWGQDGQLFRRSSKGELARLSGYSHDTVRKRLSEADGRWCFLNRAGGYEVWPRIPPTEIAPLVEQYWRQGNR